MPGSMRLALHRPLLDLSVRASGGRDVVSRCCHNTWLQVQALPMTHRNFESLGPLWALPKDGGERPFRTLHPRSTTPAI